MTEFARVAELLEAAKREHRAGIVPEARRIYSEVLGIEPDNGTALEALGQLEFQSGNLPAAEKLLRRAVSLSPQAGHLQANLANALAAQGRMDEAIELFRRALALKPESVQVLMNLAAALKNRGALEDAAQTYRRAIELQPNLPEAHNNVSLVLHALGRFEEAIHAAREAVTLRRRYASAFFNLGNALRSSGRIAEAVESYRRAIDLDGRFAEASTNLGVALDELGQPAEALEAYEQAANVCPDSAEAHNNLGSALLLRGRRAEAIDQFRQTVALRPEFVQAWDNLAVALRDQRELDESMEASRRAISINPDFLPGYRTLGGTLRDAGELDEAIACFSRAASTHSDPQAYSELLLAMLLHPQIDQRFVREEHARWNEIYAKPLVPKALRFDNDRTADRRLRIGYVSPDFNQHPVGRLILPLLANHDRSDFEIFCYSDTRRADSVTAQLRSRVDHWRDSLRLSDEQLSQIIRQDRIDVLVDLAMHTKNNRLLTFARKPAPVQVSYLAYPGTTGLDTIDYRLTDPYLDPLPVETASPMPQIGINRDISFVADGRSVYLPRTFWSYSAHPEAPAVNALPAMVSGRITFGCLNLFCKVTPEVLSLWAQLLRQARNSRLALRSLRGVHREKTRALFASAGVDTDRVEFIDRVTPEQYFRRYHQIDIALDTFPYPGGTTTCDALWMGVPVVTRAGQTSLSRGGVSILSNIGAPQLIARGTEDYLQIAISLATDLPRLADLRQSFREQMQSSPLMDARAFARGVEAAFRAMWKQFADASRADV